MFLWETVFFYIFAFGALLSSIAVVVMRNPLYSAIALILDFFFFAGLYVLLSAHFMAIVQILVYGGAIMVLFMFIIMLLNLRDDEIEQPAFRLSYAVALVVSIVFGAIVVSAVQPLWNQDVVERNRVQAVESLATAEKDGDGQPVEPLVIATPTAVPGLLADVNEAGVDKHYESRLDAWKNKRGTPADGKYRPATEREFELPPFLEGKDSRGRPKPVAFGTVEPISVLLVNRNVVPFELTAILLLAAIVGAVILAKKRL